ncbi:MAG: beta-N-acetylhexosaminidase [Thermoanaerobaculia bacterium]
MKGGELLFLGVEGTALHVDEAKVLKRVRPGGIVLVTRNIEDEPQLRQLIAALRASAPNAIFCLDAEGGRVDRLRRVVSPAPAAAELAHCPPAMARRAGRWLGEALMQLDFDLDFAPVVDLEHGNTGNALDGRTYGAKPGRVVARANALLEGLHEAGIGGCIKHFPGLGRATADTHLRGAQIRAEKVELERDRTPFTELLSATDSAMVGHAIYPGWGESTWPASLSPRISTDLLRRKSGFRGFLFSDDLEMGALSGFGALPELGARALAAGCDGLLFCRRIEAAPEIAAALRGKALRPRLEEAGLRLEKLRARLARWKKAAGDPASLSEIRERLERLAADVARRQPAPAAREIF